MKLSFLRNHRYAFMASLQLKAQADWMSGCVLRIACLSFIFLEKFLALEISVRPPPRTGNTLLLFTEKV